MDKQAIFQRYATANWQRVLKLFTVLALLVLNGYTLAQASPATNNGSTVGISSGQSLTTVVDAAAQNALTNQNANIKNNTQPQQNSSQPRSEL